MEKIKSINLEENRFNDKNLDVSKDNHIKNNEKVNNDNNLEKTKFVNLEEICDDDKKRFSCDKCDYKAINKVGLNLHKTLNHYQTDLVDKIERKDNKSVNSFSCDKCRYTAQSSTGLDAHIAFSH